jgi:hypothetical protein
MTFSSIRSSASPCAAAMRSRTCRAWASASGEPRVPIRKTAAATEDCAISPRNATPVQAGKLFRARS